MPDKTVTARPLKTPDGLRWVVTIPRKLTGGIRKRRIFASRSEAELFAASVETQRKLKMTGYESLDFQQRTIVSLALAEVGGDPALLLKAAKFYVEKHPKHSKRVQEVCEELLSAKIEAGLAKVYIGALENTFRRFRESFGIRDIAHVQPEEISEWLNQKENDRPRWEPITRQAYLKDIRNLFAFALKQKYVTENPALAVERPKDVRKAPGIFTPEEAERFMRSVEQNDPGLIPYVALILFGGLRPEESERCLPEHIGADVIILPAGRTKNNKRRLIELNQLPTLRAWLARRGDMPPVNLRKRMLAVRAATAQGGLPEVKWCHDVLRHSFVSYMVPIEGIAQTGLLADHSETVLKKHYRELVTRADAERFWKILPSIV